ncbi:MAG: aldo/keto reductase [Chitinophagaceae bacterium]|nr:aldo/keto reductase [Chitinophagaceae bacterium]
MKKIMLNDGNSIPTIGFGTYKATEEEAIAAIKFAIQKGYRLFDTAAKYENEVVVGAGIRNSGIPREALFITTKLWREELGYNEAKQAFEKSLRLLQLDYIDLYLIHWPANARNYDNWQKANADAWKAMEELQAVGKIKSIGVSNFFPAHLDALMQTATIKPVLNQIEFHPGYWQPEVTAYCRQHDIAVEAWSPLARGRVFNNPLLQSLAEKYNKSVSQICLRWIIAHGAIPIPKSTTNNRIEENIDVFDFNLTKEEIAAINTLPQMGFSGELPDIWPERLPLVD